MRCLRPAPALPVTHDSASARAAICRCQNPMSARAHRTLKRHLEAYLTVGSENATREVALLIRRARGFGAIALVIVFLAGPTFAIAHQRFEEAAIGLGLMAAIAAALIGGGRADPRHIPLLVHGCIGLIMAAIFAAAVRIDGSSPLSVMLPTPLIAGTCYLLGVRAAVGWTAVAITGMAGAVVWADATHQPHVPLDPVSMIAMGTLVLASVCAISTVGRHFSDRQSDALEFLARHDPLTGLLNRNAFEERVIEALARSQRHERRLALVFIDLDGFKDVNDEHGHGVGDRVLVTIAERIDSVTRQTDAASRLGGDEFVVLLDDVAEPKNVSLYAARLLELIERPVELGDTCITVGASLGIATFPEDGRDATSLTRAADLAMYDAKASGGRTIRRTSAPPA